MRKLIFEMYQSVMDADWNPLRKIPDMGIRHLIMQILSWMWCIVFSLYFGSFVVFGITAAAHFLLLIGIFITVSTFTVAPKVVTAKVQNNFQK